MFFSPQLILPSRRTAHAIVLTPATWDPAQLPDSSSTLSNGNKTLNWDAPPFGGDGGTRSTVSITGSTKVYVEFTHTLTSSTSGAFGLVNGSYTLGGAMINSANAFGWRFDNLAGYNSSNAFVDTVLTSSVGRMAFDMGSKKVWLDIDGNNNWYGSGGAGGNPATGTGGFDITGIGTTLWVACREAQDNHHSITARFASADWSFAAPSGFSQLAS